MNKYLSLLVCCLAARYGYATNYYVSARGSDTNPGTSPGTAWATIARVNASAHSLHPGDSILFQSGDVFEGQLVIAVSGQPGRPIVYGAYGTGAKPVISGLKTLSSWTSAGNGIYTSPCPGCTASDNMLVMDGVEQGIGRYPNSGYLAIDAINGNKAFTAASLEGQPNWTGAEVVIKKMHWIIDRNKITDQSGTTMQYISGSVYPPYLYPQVHGYGYFIQNDPRTLDAPGEWYFDPSKGNMMVFFGDQGPGSRLVQTSVIDTLVWVNARNYISFYGLSFQGGNHEAFCLHNARYVTIEHCDVDFSGRNGITASGCPYLRIAHSVFNHTNNDAMDVRFGNDHVVVEWNVIKNVALIPGMHESGNTCCDGVFLSSLGGVIQNNIIDSIGYDAITFSGDSILVKENVVSHFLLIKGDGGGIYCYSGPKAPIYHGRQVIGNMVLEGMGTTTIDRSLHGIYHGIYMDGYTPYVDVRNNTVIRCAGAGIYLNLYAQHINVTDNHVYDCGTQMEIDKDSVMPYFTISNNVLVSQSVNQYGLTIICLHPNLVSPSQLGSIDNNYYLRPDGGKGVLFQQAAAKSVYTLGDWARTSSKDASSKEMSIDEGNGNYKVLVNTSNDPKMMTLDGTYHDVKNARYSGSVTLPPYSSIVLIRGR